VVAPSAGTARLKRAMEAWGLSWGWLARSISQSPGMGSFTSTVTASFLWLRSVISHSTS
jgi:hypothetical protein